MRDPDSVGLWTQALQLLEENLGDDATKPSWKQFKESSHSIGLKTIESSLKSAEVSIQKDHPEHSISKLRWNTGSILRHLRVVFQVGDEAMKYAPETACIVWSTFSMVFKCISAEVDLCDTIMSTSERVTHWIFVGELYAKHYQPNSTGNDERAYAGCAPESQERILKNIVQIFSVVLRFCYELKQLDLSDDTPEVLEPEAKPSRWSGKRLIDRGERMVKKMGRGLKAFFGKTEDVRGFLKDGDDALRALETTSGIDWKTMATEVLNKISDNITDIKMDTQGLRKDLETVMTNIKELREQNSAQIMDVRADVTSIKERVENSSQYVEMRKWLQETTGLEREQPIQQYEEIQETMREQHCVWIHDDPSYCQWIKGNDGVCWLSGKAETGKSSMTAYVIGQLLAKPKDELQFTVYFFCQPGSESTHDYKKVMAHLLMQLVDMCDTHGSTVSPLQDDPGLNALKHDCAGILKAMKDDLRAQGPDKANLKSRGRHSVDPRGQGSTTSLDVTWQYALKAAFVKILSVFHRAFPRRKVFMLLDALDTCKQGGMESLCDILNSIAMDGEASGDIKVWITSRSPPLGKFREALKIDLSKRSSEHISDYIVTELRGMYGYNKFELFMYAVFQLKKHASSSFFRASKAIQYLQSAEAKNDPHKALENLAFILDRQYAQQMRELAGDKNRCLIACLRWLVCGCGDGGIPAQVVADEISHTYVSTYATDHRNDRRIDQIGFEDYSLKAFLEDSRDFVQLNKEKEKIELVHENIKDWVKQESDTWQKDASEKSSCLHCWQRTCQETPFEAGPKHGHLLLACHIMQTLNNEQFQRQHICQGPRYQMELELQKVLILEDGRGFEDIPLRYELAHWHCHIRRAERMWRDKDERKEAPYSALWSCLHKETMKFIDNDSIAFRVWQRRAFPEQPFKSYDSRLHYAAYYGLEEALDEFIAKGDDPLDRNEYGLTPLHLACLGVGEYIGIASLLNAMEDKNRAKDKNSEVLQEPTTRSIDYRGNDGTTAIMALISEHTRMDIFKLLVKYGARLDIRDSNGYSCLHYATKSQDLQLCRYLLAKKMVDPNVKDNEGETPLHWLLRLPNASMEVAELLLENGARVDVFDNDYQQPLWEAACTGNNDCAALILQRGADVNNQERISKRTALHAAVSEGNLELVELLLGPKTNISIQNEYGSTAVFLAVESGQYRILRTLLEFNHRRRDLNKSFGNSDEKNHEESQDPHSQEDQEAHILTICSSGDNSPLHKAAENGHTECLETILEFGEGLSLCSARNDFRETPLHLAVDHGRPECVKTLLEHQANPSAEDFSGHTPLHIAIRRDDSECVSHLLKAGADIDAKTMYGESPMMMAISQCRHESIKLLLKHTTKDSRNGSPDLDPWVRVLDEWRNSPPKETRFDGLVKELIDHYGQAVREYYFQVLNIALERRSKTVLVCCSNRLSGEDQHGWSLLSLAIQYGEFGLLRYVSLPQPQVFAPSWTQDDCLFNISDDGTEIEGIREDRWQEISATRTNIPIPAGMRSYYYEVEVLECGEVDTPERYVIIDSPAYGSLFALLKINESIVGVGFCSQFFALDKMPGWPESYPSWGYHGDDGQKFKREYEGQGHHYSESYGKGDIIGAGVDFDKQELFFTKNGEHLGTYYPYTKKAHFSTNEINLQGVAFCKDNGDKDIRGKLFPIVGMCPKGVKVKANFGTNLEEFPFKYGMVAERKDEEHQ